ncbi:MAG: Crp/Fnr family transcriptional regulator [Clostridia bacterium]|nr:Crp/Fnr family transcriptional regulator [Clostridia bacterium]
MSSAFDGLSRLQIEKIYDLLDVHIYKFNKGDAIFPTIKGGNIVGIISYGSASISYIEYNGNEIVLENLNKDSVFGSNISLISVDNCEITAKENTEVLLIDYNKLINPRNLKYPYFNIFFNNLFDIINTKFKETNERVRILEKKQIRDKLLEYFEIEYKKVLNRNINLPFALKDLADYISVNRSAMFRELKHLKEEGFIDINGKRITLQYK